VAVLFDDLVLAREHRHVVAPAAGGGMTFGLAGTF
jgi:hypothetical protein